MPKVCVAPVWSSHWKFLGCHLHIMCLWAEQAPGNVHLETPIRSSPSWMPLGKWLDLSEA